MGAEDELFIDDAIDAPTFEQILEMDDDDQHEFSRDIVFGFFDQAKQTFGDIEESLKSKDLGKLSSLGHYLKGSSATLGLVKVRDSCEKIQHFGSLMSDDGKDKIEEETALKKIGETLDTLKEDYAVVEKRFRSFYSSGADDA